MNERSFILYVEDMIEGIDKILRYVEGINGINEFLSNDMAVDAVTRNFEIIGEASKKVPQQIKLKYDEIPWKQMYGLRNFAIHEYHIIDPAILWDIIENNLVQNKISLESLIEHETNAK